MDMMSYGKLKKKNYSPGLIALPLFIILGSGIIAYSIINEPKPLIIGSDPLENVVSTSGNNVKEKEEEVASLENVSYKIVEKLITEINGNFKASISIPTLQIDTVSISEINDQILEQYMSRYTAFKKEMVGTVENKFTYKVTYNQYENIVNGEKIISLTVNERIIDDNAKTNTMEQLDTYNINVKTKEILSQETLASSLIGTNYTTLIKEQVKQKVITSKMMSEDLYNYSITGLEKCYVKDGKFHIILNPGQVVNKKYSIIDLIIIK